MEAPAAPHGDRDNLLLVVDRISQTSVLRILSLAIPPTAKGTNGRTECCVGKEPKRGAEMGWIGGVGGVTWLVTGHQKQKAPPYPPFLSTSFVLALPYTLLCRIMHGNSST